MVTIKNRLDQPLYLNLDNGESVHLLAKGKARIEEEQLKSIEVKVHINQGNIIVLSFD